MGAAQGSNFPYEPTETVTAYEGKSLWKLQYGVKKVHLNAVVHPYNEQYTLYIFDYIWSNYLFNYEKGERY